jgi:hypothetical protein
MFKVHTIDSYHMYFEEDAFQTVGEFQNLDEAIEKACELFDQLNSFEEKMVCGHYGERVIVSDTSGKTVFSADNDWREHNELVIKAYELVKARIPGVRKGTDTPAFEHSVRVYETLEAQKLPVTTCLAGMLHDIIEDGNTTLVELE